MIEGPRFREISNTEAWLARNPPAGDDANLEESLASFVQVRFMFRLGFDWQHAIDQLGRAPHRSWASKRTWQQVAEDKHKWYASFPTNWETNIMCEERGLFTRVDEIVHRCYGRLAAERR